MNKRTDYSLVWNGVLIACLAATTPAFPQDDAQTHNSKLPEWTIVPEDVGKIDHKDTYVCGMGPLARWKKIFMLSKPGQINCVAVVAVNEGQLALNPPGFEYGPIPTLKDITKAQLDELFGTPSIASIQNECTYHLKSRDESDFFIDVVLEKQHVKKYRIRSLATNSLSWLSVN